MVRIELRQQRRRFGPGYWPLGCSEGIAERF